MKYYFNYYTENDATGNIRINARDIADAVIYARDMFRALADSVGALIGADIHEIDETARRVCVWDVTDMIADENGKTLNGTRAQLERERARRCNINSANGGGCYNYFVEYVYNNGDTTTQYLPLAYDSLSALHYAAESFILDTPENTQLIEGAYIHEMPDGGGDAVGIYDITETIDLLRGVVK